MKNSNTHMANKSEHAVDLDSGTIAAVTLHPGTKNDTFAVYGTTLGICKNLADLDNGYHFKMAVSSSNKLLGTASGLRTAQNKPRPD